MPLPRWRALTIALVFASAAPPPRVSNALISAAHGHDPAEGRKTFQSRARNRINSPTPPAACPTVAAVAGGRPRPPRPRPAFGTGPAPTTPLRPCLAAPHPAPLARLRC